MSFLSRMAIVIITMSLKIISLSIVTLVTLVGASSDANLPTPGLYETRVFDRELHENVLDPELCQEHLSEMSSFEFYDAGFRVPQGILGGNLVHYGNYHQCLAVDQEITVTNHIHGKHCMVTLESLSVTLPEIPSTFWPMTGRKHAINVTQEVDNVVGQMKRYETEFLGSRLGRSAATLPSIPDIQLGICIPASCSPHDVLDRIFDGQSVVASDYSVGLCRLPEDKPLAAADIAAIVIFSLIGLVTIISTGYDIRQTLFLNKDPKKLNKLYSCASVYTNSRRLFTFRDTAMHVSFGGTQNILEMFQWYTSWQGLLLVYTTTNKLTQVGLLKNLHLFYLHRLLRVFPILAATVLLQASFFHHIADGARWDYQGSNVDYCRRHWWAALLHVQNYYNPSQMCLPHTWYLAVDIQLHMISPLVLFWVLGGRRSGWAGVLVALLVSLMASTLFIFLVIYQDGTVSQWGWRRHYYYNTLTRAPAFFVGILYGYILSIFRGKKLELSMVDLGGAKWQVTVGWLVALLLLCGSIYAYYPTDPDLSLFYMLMDSFNRSLWAAAVGWVVFACVHGFGGPVNWFLSLTPFKFLGRISYAMYILHQPIQFIWASATITTFYFSLPNLFLLFLNDVALTVTASVVVTILVDAPFSTLQNVLLGGGMQKPKTKKSLADEARATTTDDGTLTTSGPVAVYDEKATKL